MRVLYLQNGPVVDVVPGVLRVDDALVFLLPTVPMKTTTDRLVALRFPQHCRVAMRARACVSGDDIEHIFSPRLCGRFSGGGGFVRSTQSFTYIRKTQTAQCASDCWTPIAGDSILADHNAAYIF